MKYRKVALGGTFDRLHKGHEFFLHEAFRFGEKVLIGLTSDTFALSTRKSQRIKPQSFNERKDFLIRFLKKKGWVDRAQIVKINNIYGPLRELDNIDRLIVTRETRHGGTLINAGRTKKGLQKIQMIEVPLIKAQDIKRISSTRIRNGEIDRWGKVLKYQISNIKYKISGALRLQLKKPLGKLRDYFRPLPFKGSTLQGMRITVGDVVTKAHLDAGIVPDLAVVDFLIKRQQIYSDLTELGFTAQQKKRVVNVVNPAGSITKELMSAIHKGIKRYIMGGPASIILVVGEEDLAGLPAILLAPLGTRVYYGQPGEGVVEVEVSEKKKRELVKLIEKYS